MSTSRKDTLEQGLQQVQVQLNERCSQLQVEQQAQQQSVQLLTEEQQAQQRSLQLLTEQHSCLQQEILQLRQQLWLVKQQVRVEGACEASAASASKDLSTKGSGSCCTEILVCSTETATTTASAENFAALDKDGGAANACNQDECLDNSLDTDRYVFTESVWSASVFVWSPVLGKGGSMIVLLLLGLTMVMQLLFCALVLSNFTEPEFSPEVIDGLRAWRSSVGHNLRYMDDISARSLDSRVCSSGDFHHASLELSTVQASQVKLIRKYLPSTRRDEETTTADQLSSGPVLCIFILFCYYATLIQELADIVRMLWSLAVLPAQRFRVSNTGSEALCVDSIGWLRFMFLVVTGSFRAVIGGMLCYAGTLFIVQTVDMRDLLMNAVALAFVLEVDELLYAAMAPVRIRNILRMVEPLPLRLPRSKAERHPRCRCSEFASVGTIAVLSIALVLAYIFALSPVVQDLKDAEVAICGGRQSFVFTVDGSGTLSWTDSQAEKTPGNDNMYLTRALSEVINIDNSSAVTNMSRRVGSIQLLRQRHTQSVADAADEGHCVANDLDPPLLELFRELLGNASISNCNDVAEHCDDTGIVGIRARQACPQTCGCSSVAAPLFHRDPLLGCGRECSETPEWMATSTQVCQDVSAQDLASYYSNFLEAVDRHRVHSEDQQEHALLQQAAELFRVEGCGALASVHASTKSDLCLHPNLRPVLLTLCPGRCGCRNLPTKGCPLMCFTARYGVAFGDMLDSALGTEGVLHYGYAQWRHWRYYVQRRRRSWWSPATGSGPEDGPEDLTGANESAGTTTSAAAGASPTSTSDVANVTNETATTLDLAAFTTSTAPSTTASTSNRHRWTWWHWR